MADCYNFDCSLRVNESTSSFRCEYVNCPRRKDENWLINIYGPAVKEAIRRAISETPTLDTAPVVRCRDCKYNRHGGRKCLHPDSIIRTPDDDDFCSYGQRREENNGQ